MKRVLQLLIVLVAVCTSVNLSAQCGPTNNIGGNVYEDFNANGLTDANEFGLSSVMVTAYDDSGNVVGTTPSTSSGNYVLSVPNGTTVRLEFTNLPNGYEPGAAGANNVTTVAFVTSPNCNVDLGLTYPSNYCENDPRIATPCYVNGNPLGGGSAAGPDAFVGFQYSFQGDAVNYANSPPTITPSIAPDPLAVAGQIGATWGVAWDNRTETVFTSAVLKRHSGTGPFGLGGIYAITYPTTGASTVTSFFNLGDCTDLGVVDRSDLPASKELESDDFDAYEKVGKVGLGDLDLSEDGTELWTVNLNANELIKIQIRNSPSGPIQTPTCANVTTYSIPSPCGDTTRPWATTAHQGKVYVGAVCEDGSKAFVYEFDPATSAFTEVIDYDLDYAKGCAQQNVGCVWNPWDDTFQSLGGTFNEIAYPQAIASDIEFDTDGSIILGFADRFGLQTGVKNIWFDGEVEVLRSGISSGDIRYFYNDNGTFVAENDGNIVDAAGNLVRVGCNNPVPDSFEGTEFYCGDLWQNGEYHNETVMGGLALKPGSGEVVATALDPTGKAYAGGVKYLSNTTGESNRGYAVYYNANDPEEGFGKATGIGDIEVLCSAAPIEIGNRIWEDTNQNGIQDPGEAGIQGVTLNLVNAAGTIVASTTTDANGNYYFTGLDPFANYTIVVNNTNFNSGQALNTYVPTTADAGNDLIDSDGTDDGTGNFIINITTGDYGQNNHTYDFGFIANPCDDNYGINETITDVLCHNGTTGAISITVVNGTPPYAYSWADGSTTQNRTGLSTGTYFVQVTDANGCEYLSDGLFVDQPPVFSLSMDIQCEQTIAGGDGASTATPQGGTPPYTYNWSNGQTGATATNLSDEQYSVTVTDANSCTTVESVIICAAECDLEIDSVTGTDVDCNGNNNGTATATATSSQMPLSYQWIQDEMPIGQTGATATGLTAGTYKVIVTDAIGCEEEGTVVITQPETLVFTNCEAQNVTTVNGSNGALTVTVTGGNGGNTYAWSNGASGASISNLQEGSYDVTVTDSNGCSVSSSCTVQGVSCDDFDAAATANDVSCEGASDGSINVTAIGEAPLTYNWSPAGSGSSATGLGAGTYSITVTDARNCSEVVSATITEPSNLSSEMAVEDVRCNGEGNGNLDLEVTGGTEPYSFNWSNGSTTEDQTDLGPGTYTVTITDANNCTDTVTEEVAEPPVLAIDAAGAMVMDALCAGEDSGSIDMSAAGGNPPYGFLWSNGATSEDLTDVDAGTYTVTVSDIKGCQDTATFTIGEPAPIAVSITAQDVLCHGTATGAIDVSVTGGVAPFIFIWTDGAATEDRDGLATGTYFVSIIDANGCKAATESVFVDEAPIFSLSMDIQCEQTIAGGDGASTATPQGGTPPYTYAWSNGQTGATASNLNDEQYSVTVTDANSCTTVESVIICAAECDLEIDSVTGTDVDCNGNNNGTATATATSSQMPLSYQWIQDEMPIGQTAATATGLTAGTYKVIVTDAIGCEEEGTVVITQPEALVFVTCEAQNVTTLNGSDGAITITTTGGSGSNTYAWSNGATGASISNLQEGEYSVTITDANACSVSSSCTVQGVSCDDFDAAANAMHVTCAGENDGSVSVDAVGEAPFTYTWSPSGSGNSATELGAGVYSITVTDSRNCSEVVSATITEPTALSSEMAVEDVRCNGEGNGNLDLEITGGTEPYSFNWSNGSTAEDQTDLGPGTYTVTVTDANGCTDMVTEEVAEPPVLAIDATGSMVMDALCAGDDSGSIDMSAAGGTPPYGFLWSNGETSEDINGLLAGTYSVTVSDINGCQDTATFTVGEAPGVAIAIDAVDVLCHGDATGVIDVTATGGTAPYTYAWPDGATSEDRDDLPTGTYLVEVTDANGCMAMAESIFIDEPAVFSLSMDIQCEQTTAGGDGAATATPQGGTAPYTYTWSDGQTSATATNLNDEQYSVTVTDTNGCTTVESVVICAAECDLEIDTVLGTDVDCNGSSNGTATVTAMSSNEPMTYTWLQNDAPIGQSTATVNGLTAGTYKVIVVDAIGCEEEGTVVITQPDALVFMDCTVTNVSTLNGSEGALTANANGGTAPYTYTWSNGETGASISNLTEGEYSVTVMDANACEATGSCTVQGVSCDDFDAAANSTDVSCNGVSDGTINITAIGEEPFTYTWSPSGSGNSATGLGAGTYTIVVSDARGCSEELSATITEPTAMSSEIAKEDVRCFAEDNGTMDLEVTGGTEPYTFAWNDGVATEDRTGLAPGTYTVSITDANGCTDQVTETIEEPAAMEITGAGNDQLASCDGSDGVLSVSATGGRGVYTYTWSDGGAGTATRDDLPTGTYSVTVSDINNCAVVAADLFVGEEPCNADLEMNKTVNVDVVNVGEDITYTLTITNNGPADATGVEARDDMPDGLTFVDASSTDYDATTGIWMVGSIPAGQSVSLDITSTVTGTGPYTNVAQITASDQPDPDSDPNNNNPDEDDQDSVTVGGAEADLELDKTANTTNVGVGDDIIFTIAVKNNGGSDATNVEVTDVLSAGFDFVGASTATGGYIESDGTIVWSIPEIAVGQTVYLDITATVMQAGGLSNSAEITGSDQPDPDSTPGNGDPTEDDQDEVLIESAQIDLSVTKTASVSEVNVGDQFTYTLAVNNAGPSTATGVILYDLLPGQVAYMGNDPSQGYYTTDGEWVIGDIAAGVTATLEVTVEVTQSGSFTNTAQIIAANEPDVDSTPGNGDPTEDDQDSATVTGGDVADLELFKSVDADIVTVGETATFSLTVENNGPANATNVEITDQLPASMDFVSADPTNGTYIVNGSAIVWYVPELAAGESETLLLTVRVILAGDLRNNAQVTGSDQFDPDSTPDNNNPEEDDQDAADLIGTPALGSIGDYVWFDENDNGQVDPGESGIENVTVTLYDVHGDIIATTTTDAFGNYIFEGLIAEEYTVVVGDGPEGLSLNTPSPYTVNLGEGEDYVDADFGFGPADPPFATPTGTIGNFVWYDTDGDGVQDPGEEGIIGVTVTLINQDGMEVTTTTDAFGMYLFDELPASTYTVVVGDGPDGTSVSTTGTYTVELGEDENYLDADFGFTDDELCSIGKLVWEDLNGNGVQDIGENGLAGVVLELSDENGNVIATNECDTDGLYSFDDLEPGTYTVCVANDELNGYTLTTPQCYTFTVDPNGECHIMDANFGLQPACTELGSVSGLVWDDDNYDRTRDLGEAGIMGVTLYLLNADGNIVATTTTNSDGEFSFINLTEGSYMVQVANPGEIGENTTNANELTFDVACGEEVVEINFGYQLPDEDTASIGDLVYSDLNNNGIQDPGEPGVPGVTITLQDDDGNVIATTMTDGLGNYLFDGLATGNYVVLVGAGPEGSTLTTPSSFNVALDPNQAYLEADFGFAPAVTCSVTISDLVYFDDNGNLLYDFGEVGAPGIFVSLFDANGDLVSSTTTSDSGIYLFSDLAEGDYQIVVTDIYAGAGPAAIIVDVTATCNSATPASVGIHPEPVAPASIGDLVWIDSNEDGILNAGEQGIAGVEVFLYDVHGDLIATTTTNDAGLYLFEGLVPETYTVQINTATIPQGLTALSAESLEVTVVAGQNYLDADFNYNADDTPPQGCEDPWTIDLCAEPLNSVLICPEFCSENVSISEVNTQYSCTIYLGEDDGCFLFTGLPLFIGDLQLEIVACDTSGIACETVYANLTLQDSCTEEPPIAVDDNYTTPVNTPISIVVMNNDSDPNGDPIFVSEFTNPSNGTAVLNADGTFTYTPNDGFVGVDQFDYTICDNNGGCSTATVTITIEQPCNPTQELVCVIPQEGVTICPTFCIAGATITDASPTLFDCGLSIQGACVVYTALPGFTTTDQLQITACNAAGECESISVTVSAEGECDQNDPPIAVDDYAISEGGVPVVIDAIINDYDPNEGDVISITSNGQPLNGTVVVNPDGTFTYTPNDDFNGTDSFVYQICDQHGECAMATVYIEVVNPPCESEMTLCAEPMMPVSICPDFCTLSGAINIISANSTYNCSIQMIEAGCVLYTALPLFVGQETIVIVGCDEFGNCENFTVYVDVTDDCVAYYENLNSGKNDVAETNIQAANELPALSFSNIAPIPATDVLNLTFAAPTTDEQTEIAIYDLTGKLMYKQSQTAYKGQNLVQLNIANYAAGVYVVAITTNSDAINAKFVKQ